MVIDLLDINRHGDENFDGLSEAEKNLWGELGENWDSAG
jgi:hypothetical protein